MDINKFYFLCLFTICWIVVLSIKRSQILKDILTIIASTFTIFLPIIGVSSFAHFWEIIQSENGRYYLLIPVLFLFVFHQRKYEKSQYLSDNRLHGVEIAHDALQDADDLFIKPAHYELESIVKVLYVLKNERNQIKEIALADAQHPNNLRKEIERIQMDSDGHIKNSTRKTVDRHEDVINRILDDYKTVKPEIDTAIKTTKDISQHVEQSFFLTVKGWFLRIFEI